MLKLLNFTSEYGPKLINMPFSVGKFYKVTESNTEIITVQYSLLLLSWAMSFEGNMVLSLTQNVTNTFGTNNLISLLPTVLYILQTALLPMYSKLSDMYGRAQCYSVALTFYIVAYIVMATAPDYFTIIVSVLHEIIESLLNIFFRAVKLFMLLATLVLPFLVQSQSAI